jgi:ATP-dependent helicase/nuclease subunit B
LVRRAQSRILPVDETEIDRLENAALEFGWRGKKWREPLPDENHFERLRQNILPPFEKFSAQLAKIKFSRRRATGRCLARTLERFERRANSFKTWSDENPIPQFNSSAIHAFTVFEQMNSWLDNLALAFPSEPLSLRDWLPILEAGLANLTVGVIPPALDEVLIGAIDRARNPDLKLALVLGVNETIFPAAPAAPIQRF